MRLNSQRQRYSAARKKGSLARNAKRNNTALSSSFKRLGILSCSANRVPDTFCVPLRSQRLRDKTRLAAGVFARRQMCFLRLSEMFGRARARPHKCSMIQWYIPESGWMVRVKGRVGNVHLFKHLRKSAVIPPSPPLFARVHRLDILPSLVDRSLERGCESMSEKHK